MRNNRNRIISFFIILTLLFSFILPLCSCKAGSEEILSKDTLRQNVLSETKTEKNYVTDYLDRWDFPLFEGAKLKRIENLYKKHYYMALPSAYDLARATALHFLEHSYDKIDLNDTVKVTDAIITSYVSSIGDRYSFYRTSAQYNEYTSDMSGSFVGIGVNVQSSLVEDGILVISPIKNSPAEESGILAGDLIVAVDDAKVSDLGYQESVNKIKGISGSKVKISVRRGAENIDFLIVRRKVTESTVDYYIREDNIGYIDINSFKANTDELFKAAIDYMKQSGVSAIVYDVRANSGGYLDSVVNMLDYIAPDGMTLASFSNNYDSPDIARDGHYYFIPTVILCNGSSASAAELFTAGIRDVGACGYFPVTVVGETTFGKGIMQSTFTLSDSSAITMTVAFYNPPSGVNFHNKGVVPDVEVKGAAAQLSASFEEAQKLLSK